MPAIAVHGMSGRLARVADVRCFTASPMIPGYERPRPARSLSQRSEHDRRMCRTAPGQWHRERQRGTAALSVMAGSQGNGLAEHVLSDQWVQALDGGHVHTTAEELLGLTAESQERESRLTRDVVDEEVYVARRSGVAPGDGPEHANVPDPEALPQRAELRR